MARGNSAPSLGALIRALKLSAPHSLVAVGEDGEETPIALTGSRGKWERAARTCQSLHAVQVRCLDADAAMTEVIEVGPGAGVGESAQPARDANRAGELGALLKIVIAAQDAAVARQADQMVAILTAQAETMTAVTSTAISVMRITSDRTERLERMLMGLTSKREKELAEMMTELGAAAASGGGEEAEDDDPAMKMLGKVIDLATGGEPKKKTA